MLKLSSAARLRSSFSRLSSQIRRHSQEVVDSSKQPPVHKLVPLQQTGLVPSVINPWKMQVDPKGSGMTYWWNPETNETTHLGAPRPHHWVEVEDPDGSGLTYWWNPETNETTSLGMRRPNHLDAHAPKPFEVYPQVSLGKHLLRMVALGFGMSAAISFFLH